MFEVDATPRVEDRGVARVRAPMPEGDIEWRFEHLPYAVPPEMRLPMEAASNTSAITEDVAERLETHILRGSSINAARSLSGIRRKSWERWKIRANEGQEPDATLMERVRMAVAYVEARANATITAAAGHYDPRVAVPAAKLRLEYTNPAKYAPQTRAKVDVRQTSVTVNIQAVAALSSMTPEQLQALSSGATKQIGDAMVWQEAAPTRGADEDED